MIEGEASRGRGRIQRSSVLPRPFLKWAGSKHNLLVELLDVLPDEFGTYYEPFLGSGALFFHLKPRVARLSDLSHELVSVWAALKSDVGALEKHLRTYRADKNMYLSIRGSRSTHAVERAAEFIYLNRTCFNGLYRVNGKGEFNVPFGSLKPESKLFDYANLVACAGLLEQQDVTISCADFCEATKDVRPSDLVYFDPPYVTKHNFNGFRDYNEKLFSWADQERLAKEVKRLCALGAHVVVSNAAHEDIMNLYNGLEVKTFDRPSTIASKSHHRGVVTEALFYSKGGR